MKKYLIVGATLFFLASITPSYSSVDDGIFDPHLIFDQEMNRYLVVYAKADTGEVDIYGKFMNPDGTAAGDEFVISNATSSSQDEPVGTFDPLNRTFLIIWSDSRNYLSTGSDIYGQFIYQDGTLKGDNFPVDQNTGSVLRLAMAIASNGNNLAVWWDTRNGNNDIYGRIIENDGEMPDASFYIVSLVEDEKRPAIAYDAYDDRFLAVWENADVSRIIGQFLTSDGTLFNSSFPISTYSSSHEDSDVAYDPANNRFFTVWSDNRNEGTSLYDIYGQFTSYPGVTFGSTVAQNLPYYLGENDNLLPSVAFNSKNGIFLSAWVDDSDGVVEGVYVNGDSTIEGEKFAILEGISSQTAIDVSANPNCSNFLCAADFYDSDKSEYDIDFASVGDACSNAPSAPVLRSPADDGNAGTTVTFEWQSAGDPDGDDLTYTLYYCENEHFSGCDTTEVAITKSRNGAMAGLLAFIPFFGVALIPTIRRKKEMFVLLGLLFVFAFAYIKCSGTEILSKEVTGLDPGTTYYWKVSANDGHGGITHSETWSFTTD